MPVGAFLYYLKAVRVRNLVAVPSLARWGAKRGTGRSDQRG
jgi:hypothetical protein